MRQYCLLGYDSELVCYVSAKPSAGTITIYDSNGSVTSVSSAALSNVGVSTSLSSTAGSDAADPSLLQVDDASGFSAGDRARVYDSYGRQDSFLVHGADGYTIIAEDGLINSYSSGDTVETLQVKYTVDSDLFSEVASNCRARFVLTINGSSVVKDIVFDVTASPVNQPITIDNVDLIDPIAKNQLPSSMKDWSEVLERSWDTVINNLISAGLFPKYIIDDDQLIRLHHLSFRWALAEMGIEPQSDWIQGGAINYFRTEFYNTLEYTKIRWLDNNEDLIPGYDEKNRKSWAKVII